MTLNIIKRFDVCHESMVISKPALTLTLSVQPGYALQNLGGWPRGGWQHLIQVGCVTPACHVVCLFVCFHRKKMKEPPAS